MVKICSVGKYCPREFPPGTKVTFHFVTKYSKHHDDPNSTEFEILDDSRKLGKPMELLLGKQFKLEVWESIVQSMAVNEVAEFTVHKSLCVSYPFVSKTLRDAHSKDEHKHHSHHCCGAMAMQKGPKLGYEDLDHLLEHPTDLIFIIELLSVEPPETFEKEAWQMDEKEKLESIPKLREDGNSFYKNKQISQASSCYAKALGILEQLQLKEKPGDEEWLQLEDMKLPFLLNYSQCQLLLGNYYEVIEQCSQVIDKNPDNIKALYRRGLAHIKAWNPLEAKKDLEKAASLDPSLSSAVKRELQELDNMVKAKNTNDKQWLRNAFGTC
nr:EOG090X09NR [Cyclestheria hislopi]